MWNGRYGDSHFTRSLEPEFRVSGSRMPVNLKRETCDLKLRSGSEQPPPFFVTSGASVALMCSALVPAPASFSSCKDHP
jgi:hypothetical protein